MDLVQRLSLKTRQHRRIFSRRMRRFTRLCGCTPKKLSISAVVVLTFLYCIVKWNFVCTNLEINRYIDTVCHEHKSGLLLGNLCEDLCTRQNIQPNSCQAMHYGKQVVFSAVWKEKDVFVKGFSANLDHSAYPKVYQIDEATGERRYPSLPEFQEMAERYLRDNLGLSLTTGDLFTTFLELDIREDDGKEKTQVAMENLWALLQSNEFVFSQLHERYDVFPEVHGTCGALYVVERVNPLPIPGISEGSRQSFLPWTRRVQSALKILELLDEVETIFDEPLMLCDVKPDHFGISDHGRAKIIDSDNVGLRSIVDGMVGNGQNCTAHSDCDYFDCRGACDLIFGRCSGEVANDNLQMVCEKVFLAAHENFLFEFPGLLSSKHLHRKLKDLLQTCANPSGAEDAVRVAAGADIRAQLVRALREVVDISDKIAREES